MKANAKAKAKAKAKEWIPSTICRGVLHPTRQNINEEFGFFINLQKALNLLIEVYRITRKFPDEEKFGMTSDMRRASNSVMHNIAEGYGRYENKDKSRFYKISRGSAYELISQSFACNVLGYLKPSDNESLLTLCKAIISEEDLLIKSVETRGVIKKSPLPPPP